MIFLFGWGRQTRKNIGPLFARKCESCGKETIWYLSKITTWATLFFIPLIPYDKKYFFFCPGCERGVYLNYDQRIKLEPIARLNKQLVEGKITSEQYDSEIREISPPQVENTQPETQGVVSNNNAKYCTGCGKKTMRDVQFCSSCGSRFKK